MNFDEFRAELINETTALAAAETGFVDQAFVAVAGDRLIRAEELSNVTTCHAKLDGPKGKRLKIGGFDWDEDDDSLKVVVGLYHGDRVAKNLTKSIAETEFKAASAFVDAALGGWVEKQLNWNRRDENINGLELQHVLDKMAVDISVSDVPICFSLSGGIDSNLALVSCLKNNKNHKGNVD